MRKAFVVSTFLTALCLASCYLFLVRLSPSNAAQYRKLVQESKELGSQKTLEHEDAQQMREGVQKDIWIVNDHERLHFRIQSACSHLTLTQKGGKFGAVETLQGIECWVQEQINRKEGSQQVRLLFADEGIYTYPAHRFTAKTVDLEFYRVPGQELPLSLAGKIPYLTGIAQEVVLGAAMKVPTFTAYHLRAKFDPEKELP